MLEMVKFRLETGFTRFSTTVHVVALMRGWVEQVGGGCL